MMSLILTTDPRSSILLSMKLLIVFPFSKISMSHFSEEKSCITDLFVVTDAGEMTIKRQKRKMNNS